MSVDVKLPKNWGKIKLISIKKQTQSLRKKVSYGLFGQEESLTSMRNFTTGATRDNDLGKYDYEGILSPLVIERFGEYMDSHRKQADGKLRGSDNWQKGIPKEEYIKSTFRHFVDLWFIHRGHKRFDKKDGHEITIEETLCALFFNVQGYLHEVLKEKI